MAERRPYVGTVRRKQPRTTCQRARRWWGEDGKEEGRGGVAAVFGFG
jgi:hypothetical protein